MLALDFDLCATTRLWFYDLDKEKRMAEMMGMGAINKAFGSAPSNFDTSKAAYH